MSYRVVVPTIVQKQLERIPKDTRARLIERISTLAENPRPFGSIKLKGADTEYRIRVGDYRVRYEIIDKDSIVVLLSCKHRKDVYRD